MIHEDHFHFFSNKFIQNLILGILNIHKIVYLKIKILEIFCTTKKRPGAIRTFVFQIRNIFTVNFLVDIYSEKFGCFVQKADEFFFSY